MLFFSHRADDVISSDLLLSNPRLWLLFAFSQHRKHHPTLHVSTPPLRAPAHNILSSSFNPSAASCACLHMLMLRCLRPTTRRTSLIEGLAGFTVRRNKMQVKQSFYLPCIPFGVSWVAGRNSGVEAWGARSTPKVLICRKFRQNPKKFRWSGLDIF